LETLFENDFELTKELYNNVAEKLYKKFRKAYRAFVLVAFIATAGMFLFSLTLKDFLWFSIFTIVSDAFFCFMYFKAHLLYTGRKYKQMETLNGSIPHFTTLFYNDKIDVTTPRSMLTVYYDQITDVIETDKMYLLLVDKQGIMLKKDGFTKGNLDGLKALLKDKCKNIK